MNENQSTLKLDKSKKNEVATRLHFRTAYEIHPHEGLIFPEDELSLTQQQFKDECDINNIIRQWDSQGILTHVNVHNGEYADLSSYSNDYHENLNIITQAQQTFMTLPATLRDEFKNDPGNFLDFVGNPDNRDKMAEYGLLDPSKLESSSPIQTAREDSSKASKTPPSSSNGDSNDS